MFPRWMKAASTLEGCQIEIELGVRSQETTGEDNTLPWGRNPKNPIHWPLPLKTLQVITISLAAFTATLGASIVSPCHGQFMEVFDVSSTIALLPLCLYTFALGLGTVLGSPLSETVGRYPVYNCGLIFGIIFTLGAGLSRNFAEFCVLRFFAGFAFGPPLAIGPGSMKEIFEPRKQAMSTTMMILAAWMGTGTGPILGSFIVSRENWQWTQWALIYFALFTLGLTLITKETFHPVLKCRLQKCPGLPMPSRPPFRWSGIVTSVCLRPISMLFTDPITSLTSLYVSCEWATLYSFFSAVPLVYKDIYDFGIEKLGLVFVTIIIGSSLGSLTVLLFNSFLYHRRSAKYIQRSESVPPELRLFPSLMGSLGLPIGLFWFAWASRPDTAWELPAVAIVIFTWATMCIFLSMMQYIVDSYPADVVASAMSANSFARYGISAVFPLFTIQMYTKFGIGWATSLLGFLAIALLPVPWLFLIKGPKLRASSRLTESNF